MVSIPHLLVVFFVVCSLAQAANPLLEKRAQSWREKAFQLRYVDHSPQKLSQTQTQLLKEGYTGRSDLTHLTFTKGKNSVITPLPGRKAVDLQMLKKALKFYKKHGNSEKFQSIFESYTYLDFLPITLGNVLPNEAPVDFQGSCFKKLSVSLTVPATNMSYKDAAVVLQVDASEPNDITCGDSILAMSRVENHLVEIFEHGEHHIEIRKFYNQQDLDSIIKNGLTLFELPLGYAGSLASLAWHRRLFEKDTMVESNIALQKQFVDYFDFPVRPHPAPIAFNKSLVHSGDTISVQAAMPADSLIAVGTGAAIGHTTIAVWKTESNGKRELYICESTDVCEDPGKDFPPPYGQICRPWDTWIPQAYEAGFWVNICPLKPEYAAKFNEEKAWDFINSVYGQEYGYANFLYTFIDVEENKNWPQPMTDTLLEMLLGNVDRLMHDLHEPSNPKFTIYMFITQGLNQRLTHLANSTNTHLKNIPYKDGFVNCQTVQCAWEAGDQLGLGLYDMLIIPEQDEWRYPNSQTGKRDWTSEVCDVYATNVLHHAGVFEGFTFNAHEFTPRDLFSLSIYNNDPSWKPAACNQVPGDEKNGYCQLMGKYTLPLHGYASRDPYNNMYDHCGAAGWNHDYNYEPTKC